ncbi:DUF695 domain-containing protein [Vibrio alginolyticus]|uniref:DUF695 domain-containing protein n=1 Tax=Vibrio alginolyticus TaxID=663 RepID=UPI0021D06192|nr:DUF695 domain-containing protein [Vibrio alginolyticus]
MFGKIFGSNKDKAPKENEVRIALPEESYTLLEWKKDDLPCVGMLNSELIGFEHREIFGWHLSVIIDFDDLAEHGMPSEDEQAIVDPFCDQLDEEIKAGGNALFLVRETWNNTRRVVWRVYDPEVAHQHLQYIVDHYRYPRQFDWHMEQDLEWEQADWYFKQLRT